MTCDITKLEQGLLETCVFCRGDGHYTGTWRAKEIARSFCEACAGTGVDRIRKLDAQDPEFVKRHAGACALEDQGVEPPYDL